MRVLNIILPATLLVLLSGCMDSTWIGGGNAQYLENDRGELVRNCQGSHMYVSPKPAEADEFWHENNLPKGTSDFICKDGRAYLPNKVTDCQGNLIYKMEGGIDGFRKKYNLNRGKIRFRCNGNTVIPVPLSELQ